MCGRYASFREDQQLADEFAIADLADDVRLLPASWNVAPTDRVRLVVERPERLPGGSHGAVVRQLRTARWGLVPSWATDPSVGSRMINARVETLATKPAFARPLARRRAIVPADGYYEWQAPAPGSAARTKQPYYLHPEGGASLALAGLYEFWKDPARADDDPERWLVSTTILTTAATGDLAQIHDRRPVMLRPDAWDAWLDPAVGAEQALALAQRDPPPIVATAVSSLVGSVANNGPTLVVPLA